MPVKVSVVLCALLVVAGCIPDKPCAGELVYDDPSGLCYDCPKEAKYKNGTCECPEGSTYANQVCVKGDAGTPPDSGAASNDAGADAMTAYESMNCKGYCSFVGTCVGENAYAGALSDVVKGLHADDAATCESSCKGDVGSTEATEPALVCFEAGRGSAMCDDPNPQMGLKNTFTLIGTCCGPNPTSKLCQSICKTLKANPNIASMVPYCP